MRFESIRAQVRGLPRKEFKFKRSMPRSVLPGSSFLGKFYK